jgi:hypothetical protein
LGQRLFKEVLLRAKPDYKTLGKIGGLTSWSKTADRSARTAPARAAFLARFEDAPDPEAARRASFNRLALRSAEARRKTAP